jgi:NADPH2 dehydrogenase
MFLLIMLLRRGFNTEMRMEDPVPTFSYLIRTLKERHPGMAYIHMVEPRVVGNTVNDEAPSGANDEFRDIWVPKPFIAAGGFTREGAMERAEEHGDLVAFGRYFISNVSAPNVP